jgi:hypothetical protein
MGQEISWVGHCPWTGTLGFGTESGMFLVLPAPAVEQTVLPSVQVAADAVNGVAFAGEAAVFTSRQSVCLARRRGPGYLDLDRLSQPYRGGAHGVVSLPGGRFIVPVGPAGVLLLAPEEGGRGYAARIAQRSKDPLYAYRLVLAGRTDEGADVAAFAAREQGVVAFGYAGDKRLTPASGHLFRDEDIVAVCPLGHPQFPRGVAALSRECKIFLLPDVTRGAMVGGLDYPELTGTGYDLIALQGHLFVLTSTALVALPRVIAEFARGRLPGGEQEASFMPVTALTIYPADDHGIYLLDDAVTVFPVSELIGDAGVADRGYQTPHEVPATVVAVRPRTFEPEWTLSAADLELAAAA